MSSIEREASTVTRDSLRRLVGTFGASDLVMASYLVVMWSIVTVTGSSQALTRSARQLEVMLAILVGACLLGRARTGLPVWVRSAGYRVLSLGLLLASYLMLRDLLPAVRPDDLDASLLAADVRLFGVEPTLLLEPYSSPRVVEYFAFFYFSYFTICLLFAGGVIGVNRSPIATSEFAIGSSLVYCLGQLGYVAVPAHGPVHYLESQFAAPLTGGFFFRCVLETVHAGSAMKDVFPSLHTAAPVWFALFAWRRARTGGGRVWQVASALSAFFAINIVCSTVVLRWHYVVDVMAGLVLAFGAAWAAPRLTKLESELRGRLGLGHAWGFGRAS